jgi:hypothetical protein
MPMLQRKREEIRVGAVLSTSMLIWSKMTLSENLVFLNLIARLLGIMIGHYV